MDLREISLADVGRRLRASYWFLPALMVLLTLGLSFGMERFDLWLSHSPWRSVFGLASLEPEGVRVIFATIATAMITVVSVTFSMTMVSVSYAAGQIGPRLVQNFMRDRTNQMTLGVFISTFVYCLLGLRLVRGAADARVEGATGPFIPEASVLMAMGLTVLCVATFIHFVHHIPEKINVGRITAELGYELKSALGTLFPRGDDDRGPHAEATPSASDPERWQSGASIASVHDGYVEAVDLDALTELARRRDLELRLEYRPGDFVNERDVLLHAIPADRVREVDVDAMRRHFSFGEERTPTQNALFLVDQLVEILAKALSPGINDPFTALNCINWLGSALMEVVERDETESCRFDADGVERIVVHPTRFSDLASAMFDQSRQYVAADRNACLAQMRVIAEAVGRARDGRRGCLLDHAFALHRAAQESLPLEQDREAIDRRYAIVQRIADSPSLETRLRDGQGWLGGTA